MGVVLPRALFAAPITLFWTVEAMAQQVTEAAPVAVPPIPSGGLNSGDTAWMLTSTALVLMMTIPGLALFYGGMVRKMNVLATVMQSFAVTCLVTVLWMVVSYMPRLHRRIVVRRRVEPFLAARHDPRLGQRPGQDDPRIGLYDFPDGLCDHHPGADLRLLRRPDEVLGIAVVHRAVGGSCLRANRSLGMGTRRIPQ